jgi:hypothetical protein
MSKMDREPRLPGNFVFATPSFRVSASVRNSVNKCQYCDPFMDFYEVAIGIYGVIKAGIPRIPELPRWGSFI